MLRLVSREDQSDITLSGIVFRLVDDLFTFFGDTFQRRAFDRLGLFAQQREHLFQPGDMSFGLRKMAVKGRG